MVKCLGAALETAGGSRSHSGAIKIVGVMFYSRPNLPQLGIDLVEFEEDGPGMSTFWGRDVLGRPISVRYRDGWLTVESGPPGAKLHDTPDVLLKAQIGSMLHRDILKEQVCDLAGMTVHGERPVLSDEVLKEAAESANYWDWSGRTTYWVRHVFATEEGGRRLTDELRAAFPSMHILEATFESSNRRFISRSSLLGIKLGVTFGFDADEARLAKMLAREHVTLAELDQVFAHRLGFRFTWNDGIRIDRSREERLVSKYGGNIEIHPGRHLLGLGHLRTQFTTSDPKGAAYIERLIKVVEGCFSNWFEDVELGTGETIGVRTIPNWYSDDIRDWCNAAPNRYFMCHSARDGSERDIGMRPCFAPT